MLNSSSQERQRARSASEQHVASVRGVLSKDLQDACAHSTRSSSVQNKGIQQVPLQQEQLGSCSVSTPAAGATTVLFACSRFWIAMGTMPRPRTSWRLAMVSSEDGRMSCHSICPTWMGFSLWMRRLRSHKAGSQTCTRSLLPWGKDLPTSAGVHPGSAGVAVASKDVLNLLMSFSGPLCTNCHSSWVTPGGGGGGS